MLRGMNVGPSHPRRAVARLAATLFFALATHGCSASSTLIVETPPDRGAGEFAGSWRLTGTGTQGPDTDAGGSSSGGPVTLNVRIADGTTSSMVVTMLGSGSAGSDCVLNATRRGTTASLVAGETCSPGGSGVRLTITVRSGTLSLSGGVLRFDATFSVNDGSGTVSRLTLATTGGRG
jgi:hypothetical protein